MKALYNDVRRSLALEELIRAEIRSGGPMTFARFMALALYHDPLGYYRSHPDATTRAGDFLTAPETHPLFGRLLARYAASVRREIGGSEFTVVEQGAGTGALAESFLDAWPEEAGGAAVSYAIVEPYSPAAERLRARLPGEVRIVPDIGSIAPFSGLYLSNELPDAFPVNRVRSVEGGLREVFVALDGDRLIEHEGPLSSPVLADWIAVAGLEVEEGAEIEVNLGIEPWLQSVAGALEAGRILTIDYGYDASGVRRFPRGTLLAHYRHAANEDFLLRIGMQDLTAHVCWTAVERFGERAGLRRIERTNQREFLTRLGWKEHGRALMQAPGATHAELDAVDRLGRLEEGLGGLGVLVQERM
ncbi:MAG TPA: SAM-dependent methyltransferase [Armatimonadota bacterium]|jgi:SAM-dependent MidA family methyltransferase